MSPKPLAGVTVRFVVSISVAIALAGPGTRSAQASLALALEVPALARLSDRVVLADVAEIKVAWSADRRTIVSTVALDVRELWKGTLAGGRLAVVQVGGALDGVVMRVPGQPRFVPGERVVVFLSGPEKAGRIVGLGQGKREVSFDAAARRFMVAPADRSAAVDPAGDPHAAVDAPIALEELRRQVRAAASGRRQ